MAHVVYMGVQTATVISGLSNRLMLSSVELAVHAAATAVKSIRSSGEGEKSLVDHPMVKDELQAMDIEAKLKTVHALVLTIQKQRGRSPSTTTTTHQDLSTEVVEVTDESDVVGVCLQQVKEVLDSITSTVHALNEELNQHEQRWFAGWRTPDTRHHLLALRAKILILDKRVDMLLKVRSFVTEPAPMTTQRNHHLEYNSLANYGKQYSNDINSF